jgi:hypothetical protein
MILRRRRRSFTNRRFKQTLTNAMNRISTFSFDGVTLPGFDFLTFFCRVSTRRRSCCRFGRPSGLSIGILRGACPSEIPSTPPGRIAAMRTRVEAMLQAVRMVRPALEAFFQSLTDEQKERFNAIQQNTEATHRPGLAAGLCAGVRSSDRRPSDRADEASASVEY